MVSKTKNLNKLTVAILATVFAFGPVASVPLTAFAASSYTITGSSQLPEQR